MESPSRNIKAALLRANAPPDIEWLNSAYASSPGVQALVEPFLELVASQQPFMENAVQLNTVFVHAYPKLKIYLLDIRKRSELAQQFKTKASEKSFWMSSSSPRCCANSQVATLGMREMQTRPLAR
ncbi:MAG TPA: hypothetical protein VIF60_18330 [Burkholderiaceae bacterium]|jgi:hypothetical protein